MGSLGAPPRRLTCCSSICCCCPVPPHLISATHLTTSSPLFSQWSMYAHPISLIHAHPRQLFTTPCRVPPSVASPFGPFHTLVLLPLPPLCSPSVQTATLGSITMSMHGTETQTEQLRPRRASAADLLCCSASAKTAPDGGLKLFRFNRTILSPLLLQWPSMTPSTGHGRSFFQGPTQPGQPQILLRYHFLPTTTPALLRKATCHCPFVPGYMWNPPL